MTSALQRFLQQIRHAEHDFAQTLAFIERHYHYQPGAFDNGSLHNRATENEGSCKILALALLEQLSTEQALLAFGEHYRHVLASPDGQDHQNIRQLMQGGLSGVSFAQQVLSRRHNC